MIFSVAVYKDGCLLLRTFSDHSNKCCCIEVNINNIPFKKFLGWNGCPYMGYCIGWTIRSPGGQTNWLPWGSIVTGWIGITLRGNIGLFCCPIKLTKGPWGVGEIWLAAIFGRLSLYLLHSCLWFRVVPHSSTPFFVDGSGW